MLIQKSIKIKKILQFILPAKVIHSIFISSIHDHDNKKNQFQTEKFLEL